MKTSVFKILSVIALFSAAPLSRAGQVSVDSLLPSAQIEIETGSQKNDAEAIERAKLAIDKVLLLQPKNPLAWYYKGYAAYNDSILRAGKGENAAREAALNEADRALQKSIGLKRSGEALALHATVLSVLIGVRGAESGAQLGSQALQELAEARRTMPKSPRVLIQAGIAALYTPPQWGGDVREAAKLFEQAIGLFEQDKETPSLPSWGRAEAHVWLGQALQKSGDDSNAKVEFEKALAVEPNYAWVKYVLLPGVKNVVK
jgi:tetratricopeptide (TPR) repeat protein